MKLKQRILGLSIFCARPSLPHTG